MVFVTTQRFPYTLTSLFVVLLYILNILRWTLESIFCRSLSATSLSMTLLTFILGASRAVWLPDRKIEPQ